MRTIDCAQGTPEWFTARCGKVTASKISDLMARTKTGWGASRANYMAAVLAERLTGTVAEGFTNDAMRWGTETEPQARAAYEFFVERAVTEVGFVLHPTMDFAGCSPDGLVGDDGMVEIKCPNTATHIETLLGSPIPDKYQKQMQWQMRCAERDWCDFVSFDPRLPARMQMDVTRVAREPAMILEMEAAVAEFMSEVITKQDALIRKYGDAEAA